jgi:cation/acetate symporter
LPSDWLPPVSFRLSCWEFFPAIVLGIFSKRVGTVPATSGMVVGISFTAYYIIGSVYGGMSNWCFGIGPQGIGTVGMLLNFAITLGLTPFFPAPSAEVQDLIENLREPEGAGPAVMIEALAPSTSPS